MQSVGDLGNAYAPWVLRMHTDGRGEFLMNADEYRRRAGRCLVVARQTANPGEKARTVDTALMWMELAEWAEGKWPQGKQQQQVQPEQSNDGTEPLAATLRATSDRPG
jgi:hypothetical protein